MTSVVNLQAEVVDLHLTDGQSVDFDVQFLNSDGSSQVLTGKTYSSKITTRTSSTAVVTITVDTTSAATGKLVLTAELASLLTSGEEYRWRLDETTGGKTLPRLKGDVIVGAE